MILFYEAMKRARVVLVIFVLTIIIVVEFARIVCLTKRVNLINDQNCFLSEEQVISILSSERKYNRLKLSQNSVRDSNWRDVWDNKTFSESRQFMVGLWLPESLCHSCYTKELEAYRNFSSHTQYEKTLIVTNISNQRQLKSFITYNKIRIPVFSVINNEFPFNNSEEPIIFLLDPDLHILCPIVLYPGSINLMKVFFTFSKSMLSINNPNINNIQFK